MLKLGFLGVTQKTFKSQKEDIYNRSIDVLLKLSQKLSFELIYSPSLIEDPFILQKILEEWQDKIDFLLFQTTTFAGGFLGEILAKSDLPVIFWAIPELEIKGNLKWNSLCSLNFFASLIKKFNPKKKFDWIYTFPEEENKELIEILKVLKILKNLKSLKIIHLVGTAPGFFNLEVSYELLKSKFGIEIKNYPSLDIIVEIIKSLDKNELEKTKEEIKKIINIPIEEKWLDEGLKIAIALEELAKKENAKAIASRCWPDFRETLSIFPCFSFAIVSEKIPVSCEGDILSALGMYILKEISEKPTSVLDLVYYDNKSIILWHCGNTSLSLTKPPISLDYQFNHPGMGSTIDSKFKEGEVTLFSFNQDLKNALIFSGKISYPFESKFKGSFAYITDLPIKPRELFDTIVKEGFPHHLVLSYGNFVALIKKVLYWLEIPSITF
ncbi:MULTISPECIES: L-fucose isomerase-like protein [Dictyoglomus]|jgi:L-fucose isomerase-like protein|uniref:L-fucose isomerase-like protein n=1 Tax=Dictyoglomus turgidum (strain DSM 6724 / Z-1310) TaxID=515635 RepID=B8E206_DICTD|nr:MULTISPECIES: L-fucose isomerase-like protein [Dictyoglomus]ACK41789.1 L-fucose isomerase-like protein [Dictyoglomus turgidum DSM 6724]HBU31366.1 hypothetical protein [Dictyoglomus sp.]